MLLLLSKLIFLEDEISRRQNYINRHCMDQILKELTKSGNKIPCSEIRKLVNSVLNEKDLLQ